MFDTVLKLLIVGQDAFARAGGGGFGGGSFRGYTTARYFVYLIPFIIIYGFYRNYKIARRKSKVRAALRKMSEIEPEWNEISLLKIAGEKFIYLQQLWGNQDLTELKKHLTAELFNNWKIQVNEQKSRGEHNPIFRLKIQDAFIVDIKNYLDDNNDLYVVCFDAFGDDQIIRDGLCIESDRSAFREFWIFRKQEGEWKLFGISQVEGWERFVNGNLVFEKLEKKGILNP